MIAGVRGQIAQKTSDSLLVDVGGVVLRIGTSTTTLTNAGEPGDIVQLQTHLVVREDQLTLYGFMSSEELTIFETLITVSGVGPRLACAVLSRFSPDQLLGAINDGDAEMLATVPGVGRKTAARLIVELRGKLPEDMTATGLATPADTEVIEALRALGYTLGEARVAAGRVLASDHATVEDRIVAALRELSES